MQTTPKFESADAFQSDVLALPVKDVEKAVSWYSEHFGMKEIARLSDPFSTVILEREGIRIGFAVNGGDASQDGAAIQVSNIHQMREELESTGIKTVNWRVDERDGQQFQVFFVVAPDGLCFYFHEPISKD